MATIQARPYRDFLTPTLHRRFTRAATVTIAACYVASLLVGPLNHLMVLWPIGATGLRALMIFTSMLAVYILRIAQLHVGSRNTQSPFATFLAYTLRLSTIQTCLWYTFSAWFYGEVYIWSQPASANLAMVDPGRPDERPRLNERPIFIRTAFVILALVQSAFHIYRDHDRVSFPLEKIKVGQGLQDALAKSATTKLLNSAPHIFNEALKVSILVTIVSVPFYPLFLRRTMWHYTLAIARLFFTLPKSSRPSNSVSYIGDLIGRIFFQFTILTLLWQFANAAFGSYVAQDPLKKDLPLTQDSKDPNGSLLSGLKAKKEVPRHSAFWELTFISEYFQDRRVAIFQDIKRPGGSAWSQVMTVCLGELHAVVKRIQDFSTPSPEPSSALVSVEQPQNQTAKGARPVIDDPAIFNRAPKQGGNKDWIADHVGEFAKSYGSGRSGSPLQKGAKFVGDRLLTEQQKQNLTVSGATSVFHTLSIKFLKTAPGVLFRQTFARRAICVIFGAPYGSDNIIIDAITSLTRLAIHSLKEDPYGTVFPDSATIIRTYTSTITVIEGFIRALPPHWTDVEFAGRDTDRRVKEVEVLLKALKRNLRDMVNEFGEHKSSLNLSLAEMRMAKEAAAGLVE